MKKVYFILSFLPIFILFITSCNNDDDSSGAEFVPARDRGEESIVDQEIIEKYLQTHFYNYEEFENPPADFDFLIKFDTIADENASKIPLIDQTSFKTVQDRVDDDVTYKLYYLKVIQGEGDSPNFPDLSTISYEGRYLDNFLFDSSVIPVKFDQTQIVNGLQDALIEFNVSTGFSTNPDGTINFENYGVGAVFIPSGLGYYVDPPRKFGHTFIFTINFYL